MKRIALLTAALASIAVLVAGMISVAHGAGHLNDLRAVLGNDVAIEAYRKGTRPFPDGTIIARLAWQYVSSEENDKVCGRAQSFVAGPPINGVQFMVKDAREYPAPRSTRPVSPATSPARPATSSSRATRRRKVLDRPEATAATHSGGAAAIAS